MEAFWVEGLYLTRAALKKLKKSGSLTPADLELFARIVWANSHDEALRLAGEQLDGGEWHEPPKISRKSEEQRMRARGAPELPLFATPKRRRNSA